jgi:tetratricopeptide (TPR) repeat protein
MPPTPPARSTPPSDAPAGGTAATSRRQGASARLVRLLLPLVAVGGVEAAAAPAPDAPMAAAAVVTTTPPEPAAGGALSSEALSPDAAPMDPLAAAVATARMQNATGEFAEAQALLERTVADIERQGGSFDLRLVDALHGLGDALAGQGDHAAAVPVFERAQHVSKTNLGLYNVRQVAVLDSLARSLAELGEWDRATLQQEYGLQLERRAHAGSIDLVPGLNRTAEWYRRSGHVFGARAAYAEAVALLAATLPANDLRIAEALRRLAHAYRLERFPEHEVRVLADSSRASGGLTDSEPVRVNRFGPGEAALKEAIRICQRQSPPRDDLVAEALAELGDWYLLFDRHERAGIAYAEAHALLRRADRDAKLRELFGQPNRIHLRVPPLPRLASPHARARVGFLELSFDVSEGGDVSNVTVVGADHAGELESPARRALQAARYRPRLDEAGAPVATTGVSWRIEFPYVETSDS